MPVTLRKLPKLPELSKLQALLLAGGAFVFAAAWWSACRYDLFLDRTPSAPEGAVFAMTVDRASAHWAAIERSLPDRVRQASAIADGLPRATLFAVPGEGGRLDWGTAEALSSAPDRAVRRRVRIVPDGTDAVGFAVIGGTTVPFSATFDEGGFRARVGRDFLGPDFHANPFALGRRLKAAMPDQTTYLEKPAGVSWKFAAGPFGDALQRFRAFSELWMLPGRVEVTLSATQTHAINPFVLYYRPTHGRGLEGPQLESVGKALLAEAEPVGFIVTMPDASKMTELRREPDAVRIDRKPVNGFGTRATLRLPGSERRLEIFYADDGEAWLSDDLGRIQGAIMDNITTEDPNGVCEKGREGYAEMKGPVLSLHPDVPTLKRLTFGLEDVESGLFTICGYLIH